MATGRPRIDGVAPPSAGVAALPPQAWATRTDPLMSSVSPPNVPAAAYIGICTSREGAQSGSARGGSGIVAVVKSAVNHHEQRVDVLS